VTAARSKKRQNVIANRRTEPLSSQLGRSIFADSLLGWSRRGILRRWCAGRCGTTLHVGAHRVDINALRQVLGNSLFDTTAIAPDKAQQKGSDRNLRTIHHDPPHRQVSHQSKFI
jgi:hypothetical protein